MAITGVHIRLLRAAFRIQVREFAKMVGVSKSTVVYVEAGGTPQARTAQKIAMAFRDMVEFLDEDESHGPGIRLKKGWEAHVQDGEDTQATPQDTPLADTQSSLSEEDRAILLRYYRERSERWHAMSDAGREAILQSMGREAL